MKNYNLSQIMKNAHRTYKYVGKKQGKTFGEVLKSTWKLAKMHRQMELSAQKRAEEAAVEAAKRAEADRNRKVEVVSYNFEGDVYNRNSKGYMGAQYCGD